MSSQAKSLICPYCSKHIENNWRNTKTNEMVSFLNADSNVIFADGSGRFYLTCPSCQKEFQADFLIDSIHTDDQIPKNSFSDEDQKITESSKPEKIILPDEEDDEFPVTLKTVLTSNADLFNVPHFSGGILYIFDYILLGLCYLSTFLGYLVISILTIIIRLFGYLLGGKRLYHSISKQFFERDIDTVSTWTLTIGFIIIFLIFILLVVNLVNLFFPI